MRATILSPLVPWNPSHYISSWTPRDGTRVTIRPIRPEDDLVDRQVSRIDLRPHGVHALFLLMSFAARSAHEQLILIYHNSEKRLGAGCRTQMRKPEAADPGVSQFNKLQADRDPEAAGWYQINTSTKDSGPNDTPTY